MTSIEWIQPKDYIAIVGLFISSVLAIRIGIQDFLAYKNRLQLEVTRSWVGMPYEEYNITVRNLGNTPITITWWEVFWGHKDIFRRVQKVQGIEGADYDFNDFRIPEHDKKNLPFYEERSIPSKSKHKKADHIYFKIHIAGHRKPKTFQLDANTLAKEERTRTE